MGIPGFLQIWQKDKILCQPNLLFLFQSNNILLSCSNRLNWACRIAHSRLREPIWTKVGQHLNQPIEIYQKARSCTNPPIFLWPLECSNAPKAASWHVLRKLLLDIYPNEGWNIQSYNGRSMRRPSEEMRLLAKSAASTKKPKGPKLLFTARWRLISSIFSSIFASRSRFSFS